MAANSEERDDPEALGRPRCGYGTKACVIADGRGRAIAFVPGPARRTSCRWHQVCSTACRMCRAGWLATAASPPMLAVSASGTWARSLPSCPGERMRRLPAAPGSTTTATSSRTYVPAEMRFHFNEDHREMSLVRVMCSVLEVSASGYYAWRGQSESIRSPTSRALLGDIRRVHAESRRRYGRPRVHAALQVEGQRVGRNRVARPCGSTVVRYELNAASR
jgi:hypothetical protein